MGNPGSIVRSSFIVFSYQPFNVGWDGGLGSLSNSIPMILLIGGSCSECSDRTADSKVRRIRVVSSRLDREVNRTVGEEVPE